MTSDNINHQQHKMAGCQGSLMPIYAGRLWQSVNNNAVILKKKNKHNTNNLKQTTYKVHVQACENI